MEFKIDVPLDERYDSILGMRPDVVQRSQAGKVESSISQAFKSVTVRIWNHKIHLLSHLLSEIGLEWRPLFMSEAIRDQGYIDWLVRSVERQTGKNPEQR